ncbi:MAG: c-type cytochrome biogenesis protein CcmI [Rhizobiaceae bacterium]|nr:c-type cytochrome biogenesis protein CcmI [Rhizobiaceae bacterium]MCV0405468.1 c-type cytochrome biogenesis protein CcmI [Rhizobiaceae bacterium]
MTFWIIAALLTLAASLAVLWPFLRTRAGRSDHPLAHDIEVYRDQLAEVERDAARGLIGSQEAVEARAEIGRRILRLDQALADDHGRAAMPTGRRWAATAAVLVVPVAGWALYMGLGSPTFGDQPLQARLERDVASSSIEELVARAERHLAENPEDGRGWEVLAPIYMRMGRYNEAETAFRNVIRLSGATADREAGHGEAIMAVAEGLVTEDARAAFERAVELQPGHPKASFYLATAEAQEGRRDEAAERFAALLAGLPVDSPWRGAVEQALGDVRGADAPDQPGPSAADIEAAEAMSPEERGEMIEAMVARLDDRLRDNPSDTEGWKRLVRSYIMLNRRDDALAALGRATTALEGEPERLREVREFAASLGLEGTETR